MKHKKGLLIILGTTFFAGVFSEMSSMRSGITGNIIAEGSLELAAFDTIAALLFMTLFVSLCTFVVFSRKTHKK
ncbi:hypothetical protein ACFLTH_04770 [Bacteroidota bacterium]